MVLSNPLLSALITEHIGDGWVKDLAELRRWSRSPRMPRSAHAGARSSSENKRSLAALALERTGDARSIRPRCSTCSSSASTSTSGSTSRCCTSSRSITASKSNPALARRAAHVHLRRQGGARILPGEADDQADHLGGGCHQPRSGRARPAEGRVPAQFQRHQRPARLSGRRPVGADLHGRQGGVGHGQHEVLHERRAHHRHARRCEHRDARGDRRREFFPVRAIRRGGAAR